MFFRVACCLPLQIMLSHGAGWLGLGLSWLGGLALHWFCLVGLGLAGLGFWASPWLPLGFPLLGFHLASTWLPLGFPLASLGFPLASPWLPLGFPCHPLASPFPSWLSWPLLASPGPPLAHPCPPLGLPWHIFVLCPGPPCWPCLASGLVWPGVDADMQTDRQTDKRTEHVYNSRTYAILLSNRETLG